MGLSRLLRAAKIMGNTLQQPNEEGININAVIASSSSSFTCEICVEPVAAKNKFSNKNICSHPFCQDCIAKYIEVKVQEDNTAKIECPALDCKHYLDVFSCKPIIPSNLFSKWCDVLCEDYVLGFERCYCPNRNCMALVVNECERNGKVKKAKCPSCKHWFCFQCNLKWHAGYRCEESGNLRDQNDIVFGRLVEDMNWVRCPGCGHCVQRISGCYFVMCRCKTTFCYRCGGKLPLGCSCKTGDGFNCVLLIIAIAVIIACAVMIIRSAQHRGASAGQN